MTPRNFIDVNYTLWGLSIFKGLQLFCRFRTAQPGRTRRRCYTQAKPYTNIFRSYVDLVADPQNSLFSVAVQTFFFVVV